MTGEPLSAEENAIREAIGPDGSMVSVSCATGAWGNNPTVTIQGDGGQIVIPYQEGTDTYEIRTNFIERFVREGHVVQNNIREPIKGWTHCLIAGNGRCYYMAGDDHDATLAAIRHGLTIK